MGAPQKLTTAFVATLVVTSLTACGGAGRPTASTGTPVGSTAAPAVTSSGSTRAAVRAGFVAFIAAARAGGRADLADRFARAVSARDRKSFGLIHVPGAGMAPALLGTERVVGEPVPAGGLKRGDIIVYTMTAAARATCHAPAGSASQMKRVIGLPGDHVQLVPNRPDVLVNGAAYLVNGATPNAATAPTKVFAVPPGKLFVLGDNRTASCDSAVWSDPYVPVANAYWKLDGVYFPATAARLIG
jgi:signal peptidase I